MSDTPVDKVERPLDERLETEFHRCWTRQRDQHGGHTYNKQAFQDFQSMINEVVKELRTRSAAVAPDAMVVSEGMDHRAMIDRITPCPVGTKLYKTPQSATESILKAIDDEPELPGDMPDAMWEAINGDRDATQAAMRIAVRQTKAGIRDRVTKSVPDRRVTRG